MGPIVVLGSINMDLVCRTPHMPRPGETILGSAFATVPGGKGANQAVAAARLSRPGAEVHMIGRVGDDDFGRRLLAGLKHHGVRTAHVTVTQGTASGVAVILVDEAGENSIVVAPGANAQLVEEDVDRAEPLIRSASAVVMQLEVPVRTVRHAIALCRRLGVHTILDPAPVPAKPLPRALYEVDVFTPNESEARLLLRQPTARGATGKRAPGPEQVATELQSRGARGVVLKLGGRGSMLVGRDGSVVEAEPFKVKVVDTTAAGDSFTAALAVGHAEGMDDAAVLRFANAAGALCCTGFGAQPSLPSREAVDRLVATRARR